MDELYQLRLLIHLNSLADQLAGKRFAGPNENAADHIGYVSLKSVTDGDTLTLLKTIMLIIR